MVQRRVSDSTVVMGAACEPEACFTKTVRTHPLPISAH